MPENQRMKRKVEELENTNDDESKRILRQPAEIAEYIFIVYAKLLHKKFTKIWQIHKNFEERTLMKL